MFIEFLNNRKTMRPTPKYTSSRFEQICEKIFCDYNISVENWEEQYNFLLRKYCNVKFEEKWFSQNFFMFIQTKCGSELVLKWIGIKSTNIKNCQV